MKPEADTTEGIPKHLGAEGFLVKFGAEDDRSKMLADPYTQGIAIDAERAAVEMQKDILSEQEKPEESQKGFQQILLEGFRKIGIAATLPHLLYLAEHWERGDNVAETCKHQLDLVLQRRKKSPTLPLSLSNEDIAAFPLIKGDVEALKNHIEGLVDLKNTIAVKAIKLVNAYNDNLAMLRLTEADKDEVERRTEQQIKQGALESSIKAIFVPGDRGKIGVPVVKFIREYAGDEIADMFGNEFKKTQKVKAGRPIDLGADHYR